MPTLLLADLLSPDRVKIPLESTDKAGLIKELSSMLARVSGLEEDRDAILRSVLEREAKLSTGIGSGVALPHGKCSVLDGLVLVGGRTSRPVDFDALDSEPVNLVLMLVGPESAAGLHVKVLGQISKILRERTVRQQLIAADSPGEFLAAIREAESR